MIDFDLLMRGAIDMHLHHGPDIKRVRVNALEAAQQAQQAGMRAIVLKSHSYPTTPLALTVNQLFPNVKVFGSICLDYEIGGLNSYALDLSAKLGAKVVWMPTFSSFNSRTKMRKFGMNLEGEGFSILDSKEQLAPEISSILSLVKKYEMTLASGHLSPIETFTLIDEALKKGIQRLVITHPSNVEFVDQALNLEELKRLSLMGAFIEYTYVGLLPTEFSHNPAHMVERIKYIGAEHCIMSTDLGQFHNPTPAEGMRLFIATLLNNGVKEKDIEIMVKVNPARLLGLD